MRRLRVKLAIGVAAIGVVVTAAAAVAGDHARVKTALTGYEETPQAISTDGNGTLDVTISNGGDAIDYELTYDDLEGGAVQQAHIHFGQEGVTGGVSAFLCSNLGNGPAGTQACPPPPATVTGTITTDQIVGPATQGIAAGELDELIRAIRAGVAYGNVHTATYPTGEIRGQLDGDRGHGDGH
jgi:hypothetical protein